MLRRTLTILSLIGLLLSVGLWGVSYFNLSFSFYSTTIYLGMGVLEWHYLSRVYDPSTNDATKEQYDEWLAEYNAQYGPEWNCDGYQGLDTLWIPEWYARGHDWGATMPLWMFSVLLGFVFWLAYSSLHRCRKRKKLGLCLKCGYDLSGSKDRCPECGEEFEKQ